jgi:hypothetical protein
MALGWPVDNVLAEMRDIGVYREGVGVWDEQVEYYLLRYKIACRQILNEANTALACGHYLASIPSLNFVGKCHTVLVHATEDFVKVYDPNNGREDKKFYDFDSFEHLPVTYFTFLNDFRNIDRYGKVRDAD